MTILDVAAASGVSRATVSLVLRDEPRVAEGTRQRVHEAIERLGYVYDRRAANMRTQRSMTVGLVVTDVRNPFFAELTMAVEKALEARGYSMLQAYSLDEREREARLLGVVIEQRVDGVILLPSTDTEAMDLQRRLSAVPHVLIARSVADHDADYVGVDNVRAGRLLGKHLGDEGYRDVAFLGGPRSTARGDRLRGLRSGLARHGVKIDAKRNIQTGASRVGGIQALEALLETGALPDAIACYSDIVAIGVASALRAAGIEPGRDVAVGSFDDNPGSSLQHPALTSVATYPERVGAEAARLLIERIDAPDLEARRVILAPTLSVRASSTTLERRQAA
ncbi:LacI family transcriptional regulator [Solirubrobacter taibaiensis]|nr:LacI family transcriptional regulator [Solirubrobacter taibaiensis]